MRQRDYSEYAVAGCRASRTNGSEEQNRPGSAVEIGSEMKVSVDHKIRTSVSRKEYPANIVPRGVWWPSEGGVRVIQRSEGGDVLDASICGRSYALQASQSQIYVSQQLLASNTSLWGLCLWVGLWFVGLVYGPVLAWLMFAGTATDQALLEWKGLLGP